MESLFNLVGKLLLHRTLEVTLRLNHPTWIWCITSLVLSQLLYINNPKYIKLVLFATTYSPTATWGSPNCSSPLEFYHNYFDLKELICNPFSYKVSLYYLLLPTLTSSLVSAMSKISSVNNMHQETLSRT